MIKLNTEKDTKPSVSLDTTNGNFILKSSGRVSTTITGNKIIMKNLDTGEIIEKEFKSSCIKPLVKEDL